MSETSRRHKSKVSTILNCVVSRYGSSEERTMKYTVIVQKGPNS